MYFLKFSCFSLHEYFVFQGVLQFDNDTKVRIDNLKVKLTVLLNKILDICTTGKEANDNAGDFEDVDIERKIKKTKEFVSRFSRNYLYQLKRQVRLKEQYYILFLTVVNKLIVAVIFVG